MVHSSHVLSVTKRQGSSYGRCLRWRVGRCRDFKLELIVYLQTVPVNNNHPNIEKIAIHCLVPTKRIPSRLLGFLISATSSQEARG
jgi:hypothetical protein